MTGRIVRDDGQNLGPDRGCRRHRESEVRSRDPRGQREEEWGEGFHRLKNGVGIQRWGFSLGPGWFTWDLARPAAGRP
jgi:hypothetical protein